MMHGRTWLAGKFRAWTLGSGPLGSAVVLGVGQAVLGMKLGSRMHSLPRGFWPLP